MIQEVGDLSEQASPDIVSATVLPHLGRLLSWPNNTADHVNGCLSQSTIVRTRQSLAIKRHDFAISDLTDPLDPTDEATVELVRIKESKHPSKSVVGRYAVGQFQKSAKLVNLGVAEFPNVAPRVSTADHGADGYDYDVKDLMQFRAINPGVFQVGKVVADSDRSTAPPSPPARPRRGSCAGP